MQNQVDLYTGPHKGQRLRFFTISKTCGTLDLSNQNALTTLESELASFRDNMYLHANIEEKFIHPLLSERVPGGADKLNDDHRIMHQQFDELVSCFGEIKKHPREELSLEFYLAWNRFTSFYLKHIDYEEEYIMPALWKLCTSDELGYVFKKIMASQTPKELTENLEMMLPAMSPAERSMLLNQARATMPPEALQAALKLAERVLAPEDWTSLKASLKL